MAGIGKDRKVPSFFQLIGIVYRVALWNIKFLLWHALHYLVLIPSRQVLSRRKVLEVRSISFLILYSLLPAL